MNSANPARLTVYRAGEAFSFWDGQGQPVELELAPGWSKGLSQFGRTMLLGPEREALDIPTALQRGVTRIL